MNFILNCWFVKCGFECCEFQVELSGNDEEEDDAGDLELPTYRSRDRRTALFYVRITTMSTTVTPVSMELQLEACMRTNRGGVMAAVVQRLIPG